MYPLVNTQSVNRFKDNQQHDNCSFTNMKNQYLTMEYVKMK